MKKSIIRSLVIVLITAIGFVSCDTEPVDPVLNDNNNNGENPGNNPGTNPGTEPGTSDGDYWPYAINNQWVFEQDGEANQPMKITSTESVNNKTYYKIDHFFENEGTGDGFTGNATMLLRKEGGSYSVRVSVEIPSEEGMSITVSPFEYIFLKDNLEVGQTWTDTAEQVTSYEIEGSPIPMPDVVMNLTFEGKILAKDVTVTVNGVTYNDVIKISFKQTAVIEGMGTETVTNSEIWFAKNIGPVKSVANAGTDTFTQELQSYILN